MKKEIDPKVAAIAGVVLLLLLGGGYFIMSRGPAPVTVSNLPKDQLEDKDPPHRGQKGYRQRIGDAPDPGTNDDGKPHGRPD